RGGPLARVPVRLPGPLRPLGGARSLRTRLPWSRADVLRGDRRDCALLAARPDVHARRQSAGLAAALPAARAACLRTPGVRRAAVRRRLAARRCADADVHAGPGAAAAVRTGRLPADALAAARRRSPERVPLRRPDTARRAAGAA